MSHYVCSSCGSQSDVPDRCRRLGCDKEDTEMSECNCTGGPDNCEMVAGLKSSEADSEYSFDEWGGDSLEL